MMEASNQDNPYRSPESITGDAPRRPVELSRPQLYAIARWQKCLRFRFTCGIGVLLTGFVFRGLVGLQFSSANASPSWLEMLFIGLFVVLAAVFFIAWLLALMSAITLVAHFSNVWLAICAGILLIPIIPSFLGPIIAFVIDRHATRVLKRHGIHVGWRGAELREQVTGDRGQQTRGSG